MTFGRSALSAVTCGFLALGCARSSPDGGPRLHFVVVTHGQAADPFWSVVKQGVDDAAKDLRARVDYRAPETFDVVRMAQLLEAAVASKPDGIAVSLPDPDALAEPLKRAASAMIPLISFNSGKAHRARLGIPLHVGQDERDAGHRAGVRMKEAGVRRAFCVNHEVGNVALDRRCEGFEEGLGHPVEVIATDLDPTASRARIYAALEAAGSDLTGVLALGPPAALATVGAIEQAGRSKEVTLATFDLSPEVLDAIEAGKIAYALDQQQYAQGYLSVVLLAQRVRTGIFPSTDILTGPGFVTRSEVAQVREGAAAGLR